MGKKENIHRHLEEPRAERKSSGLDMARAFCEGENSGRDSEIATDSRHSGETVAF